MSDTPNTLGQAWKQARKDKKLSQEDLAARLGISESYLSLIENDHRMPPVPLLKRMAEVTKRSMESLCPEPEVSIDSDGKK